MCPFPERTFPRRCVRVLADDTWTPLLFDIVNADHGPSVTGGLSRHAVLPASTRLVNLALG